jgi:RimJ/RimL family protein N-acetyltransferase
MIRPLTIDEIEQDAGNGTLCYKELNFPSEFDPAHFVDVWRAFYESHVGIILVSEDEGVHTGYIGGIIYIDPFDRLLKSQEFIWYVKPKYRSPELAQSLLQAFEQWSAENKARYLRIAAPRAKAPLGYLLKQHGYRELETVFEREL